MFLAAQLYTSFLAVGIGDPCLTDTDEKAEVISSGSQSYQVAHPDSEIMFI